jgi:pimeloyl-ACP methyl ester carboxylesterase
LELHFESAGDGPPLVLLHGFGATLFTWRLLLPSLAASHEVVRLDLLGFGGSPKPHDGDYSISGQSTLLEHFLAARRLQDVTLIGHSLGGAVALFTALRLKESGLIRSLVLIDAPAYGQTLQLFIRALRTPLGPALTRMTPAEIQVRAVLKLAYFDNAAVPNESVRVYANALRSPGAGHALVQTARQLIPPDIEALSQTYPQVRLPTLLVWGRHDDIVPLSTGERLARELPRASLVVIERAGHLPQEEAPAETVRALTGFLGA